MLELSLAVNSLVWAADHARGVLGQRRVPGQSFFAGAVGDLTYRPYGAVAVIGSTDLPLYAPIAAIGSALAAGNTVVFKPSEFATRTGRYIARLFSKTLGPPVLRCVEGDGETGVELCAADVDAVVFVGSERVGRAIMAACADRLTPLVLQCGGKDSAIVDRDAPIGVAVEATATAAFIGSGQAAVGVQRAWVHADVYDEFLRRLLQRTARLTVSSDPWADLGPLTKPERCEALRAVVDDAVGRGARVVAGGSEEIDAPFAAPTILVDVPAGARVATETVAAPILSVTRVDSTREAAALAQTTSGGVASAVFGRAAAGYLARTSRTGMTSINSALGWAGLPALPFGGTSGFGRLGGADGLRALSQPKAVARRAPLRLAGGPVLFGGDSREFSARTAQRLQIRFGRNR
jgi:aldehyde dehydrogenase (NAD+)